MYEIPILFIVFRRPETTLRVFNVIREIRPRKLYISCNAPNELDQDEVLRCQHVRSIVSEIDWDCQVYTNFRDVPVDSRTSIENAINWMFENEEYGIILEDDVLPDVTFFEYVKQLLFKYKDNHKIFGISGNCFIKNKKKDADYYFSQYAHIWGWATWRRSWILYENNLKKYNEQSLIEVICSVTSREDFLKYWLQRFSGDYVTYDYALNFSMWKNKKYMIAPTVNLVKNIGFGRYATHTLDDGGWVARLHSKKMSFPMRHPSQIVVSGNHDRWEDIHVFRTKLDFFRKVLSNFPLLYSIVKFCYRKIIN